MLPFWMHLYLKPLLNRARRIHTNFSSYMSRGLSELSIGMVGGCLEMGWGGGLLI